MIAILAARIRNQAELNVSHVVERRVRSEQSIHLVVQHRELVKSEAEAKAGVKNPLRGKSNETINGKL